MSRYTVQSMHGNKALALGSNLFQSLLSLRRTDSSAVKVTDLTPLPSSDSFQFEGAPKRSALRSQSIRYELLANSGRYCSLKKVATGTQPLELSKPMQWLVLSPEHAEFFAPRGDTTGEAILNSLRCVLSDKKTGKAAEKLLIPVHWQEAEVLKTQIPDLVFLTDGEVFAGASPRSLFFGPSEGNEPKLASATKDFCIKTHLSEKAYSQLGGLSGSRELNRNDCLMASVISHVLMSLKPNISPLVDFQSESRTVVAKLKPATDSSKALEVGAIFRELTAEPLVPGFALFSETTERLPHVPASEGVVEVSDGRPYVERPRVLAREAIAFALEKNPDLSRNEVFLRLFVDPLLDAFFSMAREGISMELHSQNFLLGFDPESGLVNRLVIRDLHGINYSHAYRKREGKSDLFSVEALKPHFPNIRQEDIDGYFMRNGAIRDRYLEPAMWKSTIDFFMSSFWFQTLAATSPDPFSEVERERLMNRIRDRVSEKAEAYQFDLSQLPQPSSTVQFHTLAQNGIRGRIIFRHPVKKGADHVS